MSLVPRLFQQQLIANGSVLIQSVVIWQGAITTLARFTTGKLPLERKDAHHDHHITCDCMERAGTVPYSS